MYTPKYPQLQQHQWVISATGFLNRLLPSTESRAGLLITQPREWHNVVILNPNSKSPKLCVRVFMLGEQVTIAQLPLANLQNAFRIADMATLAFQKYRVRKIGVRLNLSEEQARYDLEHEQVHRDLLKDYETMLIEVGLLPTAEQLAERKAASETPEKRAHTSLRSGFGEVSGKIEKLMSLEPRIANLETGIASLASKIDAIPDYPAAKLDTVSTQLEAVDTSLAASNSLYEKLDNKLDLINESLKQVVVALVNLNNKIK